MIIEIDEKNITGKQNLVKVEIIAQIFQITVRRVQQLTQDGTIHTVKNPDGGRNAYDLIPTIMEYIKFLSDKAYGRAESAKEFELKNKKLEAEVALKDSQAELHVIKTDIAKGKYIPVEEVELDYKKFFAIFKKFAGSIPFRIAGILNGYLDPVVARGIEKDLSNEITQMLRTFVVSAEAKEEEEK